MTATLIAAERLSLLICLIKYCALESVEQSYDNALTVIESGGKFGDMLKEKECD